MYRELPHALRVVLSLNPEKLNHNRFNVDDVVEVEESISNNEAGVTMVERKQPKISPQNSRIRIQPRFSRTS